MNEVSKTFHVLLKQTNSVEDNQQQLSNLLCKLNPFQIDELDMMYQRVSKLTDIINYINIYIRNVVTAL
uniref:Uncharacterized protein n=1 Tax=Schistosoma haematobium TaxID=6185 RepID=A0A095A0B0_SCHHA